MITKNNLLSFATVTLCILNNFHLFAEKKVMRNLQNKNKSQTNNIELREKSSGKYILPELPYKYDALNPYIDTKTMKIHHNKHHKAYVDNLNKALNSNDKKYFKYSLEYLFKNLDKLPKDIKKAVQNHGGGHYNHSLFWLTMTPNPKGEPTGQLKEAIEKKYGNFESFKDAFSQNAKDIFGSGWAWLSLDKNNNLIIHSTQNQDNPIMFGYTPLLGLDVWEHAYYLKYQNDRGEFIKNWWNVVNWPYIQKTYDLALNNKV